MINHDGSSHDVEFQQSQGQGIFFSARILIALKLKRIDLWAEPENPNRMIYKLWSYEFPFLINNS